MSEGQSLVALVTGGASGIGAEVVLRLAANENVTVYTLDRSEQDWRNAVAANPTLDRVTFRCINMRDHDVLRSYVADIVEREGAIDVLVNNAGIMPMCATHDVSEDSISEQLDVLLHGPILLSQLVIAALLAQKRGGQIINISSVVASFPSPKMAVYGAAKAGLLHFTRTIAAEYAANGIRANAVCPGVVDTHLAAKAVLTQLGRSAALGRLARPGEIADMVVHLLGSACAYVTGAAFAVDGGVSLGQTAAGTQPIPTAATLDSLALPAFQAAPAPQASEPAPAKAAKPQTPAPAPAAAAVGTDVDQEMLRRVAEQFETVFAFEAAGVTPDTTPDDVEKWDSLGHMNLVAALETSLSLRFDVDEVMEMTSVAEILRIVAIKTGA